MSLVRRLARDAQRLGDLLPGPALVNCTFHRVTLHAVGQASEAGLGSIEHMSYLLRGGSPREAELSAAVAAGRMAAADAVTAMIDGFDEMTALAAFRRLVTELRAAT